MMRTTTCLRVICTRLNYLFFLEVKVQYLTCLTTKTFSAIFFLLSSGFGQHESNGTKRKMNLGTSRCAKSRLKFYHPAIQVLIFVTRNMKICISRIHRNPAVNLMFVIIRISPFRTFKYHIFIIKFLMLKEVEQVMSKGRANLRSKVAILKDCQFANVTHISSKRIHIKKLFFLFATLVYDVI